MSSSRPHRCDEFPAEYSLASCSPAELASASSASVMLQPTTLVRRANFSERQPGSFRTVSTEGVTLSAMQLQGFLTKIFHLPFRF
jgi:hypothetical protein